MHINKPIEDVKHANPAVQGFERLCWATAGLVEEAAEVLKILNCMNWKMNRKGYTDADWKDELGDVFWFLAQVAHCKGLTLEEIWEHNQSKLTQRLGEDQKNV